ncbi:ExbD/TolR family protein [Coraliomargarita parva]|uniref:ExbD/TolR family protein n=1 Tax=Coraliomargarita parva TaxID=3014050 RepID=UPI0022B4D2F8|nr:biopolymer transporter ExbD [Coraliomargarita parva]
MPPSSQQLRLQAGRGSRVATLRRLRSRRRKEENIEVDISPLIDCVFLLLIFFLVTTMLKKLEKQIPVELPDYTSAIASVSESDTIIYALDQDGNFLRARDKARSLNGLYYDPVPSFIADLKKVAEAHGTNIPIRLDTDRDVPVQKVIDALDILSLQGFEKVGVRLRYRNNIDYALEGLR